MNKEKEKPYSVHEANFFFFFCYSDVNLEYFTYFHTYVHIYVHLYIYTQSHEQLF